jgi:type IV pilus assembly protein PilE
VYANQAAVWDQDPVAALALASLTVALFLFLRRTKRGSRQCDRVAGEQVEAMVRWPWARRRAPAAAAASRGFTLAELMITVAIVAILAAIAIPTYRDHVRTSRRTEAQAYLMAIASRQQQFLMDTRAYAGALTAINIPTPANVSAAYDLTLVAAGGPPPTFSITATPKAGSDQTREKCQVLAIDQTGAKTAALSRCW